MSLFGQLESAHLDDHFNKCVPKNKENNPKCLTAMLVKSLVVGTALLSRVIQHTAVGFLSSFHLLWLGLFPCSDLNLLPLPPSIC